MENFNLLAFYDLRRGTDMEYSIDTWNLERNRGKYTRTAGRTDVEERGGNNINLGDCRGSKRVHSLGVHLFKAIVGFLIITVGRVYINPSIRNGRRRRLPDLCRVVRIT